MPRTTAQQERSLQDPAVCELLKIRDFLDNVMVRTDGCYVAGFRVQGSVTYFADDEGRNEAKGVVESLLRAMPEQSMRVQFRYEVVESLNGLLDRYRDASRSETPEVKVLDDRRLATWEEKERVGAYLSRISGVYLIWDPVKHKRAAAIEDEDQVQLLVYMTSSIDLLYQLKAEFEEQGFPIALVTARSFCMSPLATRMYSTRSLGGQKATLEDVLAAVPRRKRVPPGE
jgi:hypothetical protein